jgi:aryl-alcohol dehydrogenase-like predicted oxidoreductase
MIIKRNIGETGMAITPLVMGGNVFGWTLSKQASFEILDAFVDKGGNMIDTADQYAIWVPGNKGGESETIIGEWLQKSKNRDKVFIATKVGGVTKFNDKPNTSKQHILKSIDNSLQRLQTDVIDLYYTHFDDLQTPVEETLAIYHQLIKAGKIKAIGVSNMQADRIAASQQYCKVQQKPMYQVLQPEYNLYYREKFEKHYATLAAQYNMNVFTYFSLASGFLTGKYRTEKDCENGARANGMKAMLNKRGLVILDALDYIANQHNSAPASVALAWLLAQKNITAPIVSATNQNQLESHFQALTLQLTSVDIEYLNNASAY